MYRAFYRERDDGDWDLMAVFGLEVNEDVNEMPNHRLEAFIEAMFCPGQEATRCMEYDQLAEVVDVLDGAVPASETRYLIQYTAEGPDKGSYWSDVHGWTGRKEATRYTDTTSTLPDNSMWVEFASAADIEAD